MKIILLTLLLLLTGGEIFAVELKPPSPTPIKLSNKQQKETQNHQTEPQYNKRGTKDFPFIVETLEGKSDAAEKERNAKHREKEASNSRNTMLLTIGLLIVAVFQIGFFYWQLRLMRKNFKDTEKAADAAKKSADALIMIERAYIFASVRIDNGTLIVDLENHGKTPAILKSLYVTRKLNTTPPQELDSRAKSPIPDGIVIVNGKPWSGYVTPDIIDGEWELIEGGEFILFCYGVAEYMDVLNKKRTTGFCWQFNYESCRWSIADSKLNYYDSELNDITQHHFPKV